MASGRRPIGTVAPTLLCVIQRFISKQTGFCPRWICLEFRGDHSGYRPGPCPYCRGPRGKHCAAHRCTTGGLSPAVGRQSQFSALLEMESPEGRFGPLLEWARDRLTEPLSVEQLAERAAMSPRNFARRFREETGSTPARAIERLRVEAAREWIEAGKEPVEQIARRAGFRDPDRMRRAFLRAFGQPPQALRRAAKM